MNQELYIGMDVGGTNIKCGLVTAEGVLVDEKKMATEIKSGGEHVLGRMEAAIHGMVEVPPGTKQTTTVINEGKKHVFISYAHVDFQYFERILVHLKPIVDLGIVDIWSDTRLQAGDNWHSAICLALKQARVAVLLISADYLASDFIRNSELPSLLSNAEHQGTRIISVILKPSGFLRDKKLSCFQALNPPEKPVVKMSECNREALYERLVDEIYPSQGPFGKRICYA